MCNTPAGTANPATPYCTSLLVPRLQDREGVKARQVLIDVGLGTGVGEANKITAGSMMELKWKVDEALAHCSCDSQGTKHNMKVVTHPKNGGILMELGSDNAVA